LQNIEACWVCNGYYGPNYDEPLCGTCHAFLFDPEAQEIETTISDDEDSGNDEPPFKDKRGVEEGEDEDEEEEDDGVAQRNANNDEESVSGDEVEIGEDDIDEDERNVDQGERAEALENNPGNQQANRLNIELDGAAEALFNNSPEEPSPDNLLLLPMQRPRPPPPRSLPHFMELLSEARNNDKQICEIDKKNILNLPVEIMVMIFSYLDDMSMWKAGQVCKQWHSILEKNTSPLMWKKYFKERWPLFRSSVEVNDWLKLYGALMLSCFCRTCILQMALKTPTHNRQNAIRMKFLRNDCYLVNAYATEGIEAIPLDKQSTYWQASILGPAGSPYEGGKFFLFIYFPER